MESRPDSSAAAMAARSPAPAPPITSTACWYASLPGILRHSFLVKVTAVAVIDHDGREILDLDAPDGLRPEVLVRDDVDLPDEPGQHGTRTSDRAKVDALELHERVFHRLRARAFPHGPLEAEFQQRRRELVHATTRRGSDRPDHVARPRRRGAGVVDDLAAQVEGQRPPRLDQREQPAMGRVTGRVDHARDADAVS